jgi:two-component system sensor histidine kinase UhpB
MPNPQLNLDIVLVFFVYGLAFFTMGIALTLEASRSPGLAETHIIRPLAVFGLLHGAHEWMEIILLQGVWLEAPFPAQLSVARVVLLAVSFSALLIFAAMVFRSGQNLNRLLTYTAIGFIFAYVLVVMLRGRLGDRHFIQTADALARYLLAVPGGILAGLALLFQGRKRTQTGHGQVARHFKWSALGFGFYGLTQMFVSAGGLPLSQVINTEAFQASLGIPIQLVRAVTAVFITVHLIRAIQIVEQERDAQLRGAQRARLEALEQVQQELVAREKMRRELLQHTVLAQEEERGRIARELHDETAQLLTAFTLNVAALKGLMPATPRASELLGRLQRLSHQMSEGIYRLVHDLRPAQLDDLGLVAALQYISEDEENRTGVKVALDIQGAKRRLDSLAETVLFRVTQEALTNVARHAGTTQAQVQLQFLPEQVILRVCDQGLGFKIEELPVKQRGWGLVGMRERVESIGGEFHILSSPGQGTELEILLPVAKFDPNSQEEVT